MAPSSSHSCTFPCFMLFLSLFLVPALSLASPSSNPKSIVLKVSKDPGSLQYFATLGLGTPAVAFKMVVDLGGESFWVDCQQGYKSSSYVQPDCPSEQCSSARARCGGCFLSPVFACYDHKCGRFLDNSVQKHAFYGIVSQDEISMKSAGLDVRVPGTVFICGETVALEGLAEGVKGIMGLGKTNISTVTQFASTFQLQRKFSVCLSSSLRSDGQLVIGDRPQHSIKSMTYTPLITNPVSTASAFFPGESSAEYFIGLKAIRVNGKPVQIDKSLLQIKDDGQGGTKISTVVPYTVMQTSIFSAVINAIATELGHSTRVAAVKPFGACFESNHVEKGSSGSHVPDIDLVLQNDRVFWRLGDVNSMVKINKSLTCLGLVDGGTYPVGPSIVIGGKQLEDTLLEFNLEESVLGISSAECSKLNLA
ncbi:hypothetical protein MLD38_020491 [Melastoma candidum]|uniref:Uncharacterized protein n=1 Tax=Melastoma candidum TaxID=119954 RepID=A0ACB9QDG4_9MYRT|nr:hypothetical protein MLD38_020491 [Melastoma candidum]